MRTLRSLGDRRSSCGIAWPFGIFVLPTLPRMDAARGQGACLAGRRSVPPPSSSLAGYVCGWWAGYDPRRRRLGLPSAMTELVPPARRLLRTDWPRVRRGPAGLGRCHRDLPGWISLLRAHLPGRAASLHGSMSEVRTTQARCSCCYLRPRRRPVFGVHAFLCRSLVLPVILTLTLLMGSDQGGRCARRHQACASSALCHGLGVGPFTPRRLPSDTLITHNDWDADMTLDAPDIVEVVDVGVWTASIAWASAALRCLIDTSGLTSPLDPDGHPYGTGVRWMVELGLRSRQDEHVIKLNASWGGEARRPASPRRLGREHPLGGSLNRPSLSCPPKEPDLG